MAYTPNTWQPRIVQYPTRFTDQNGNTYNFTSSPGTVTQQGTAFSAEWMNHIEDGIEEAYPTLQSITLPVSAWVGTPNMPLATAAYDDTTGVYTLTMPEGWTFTSGDLAAFSVPEAPGEASSVSIVIGSLTFPMAEVPTWTAEEIAAVVLTETDGTYAAAVSPTAYALEAPFRQQAAGVALTAGDKPNLSADVQTLTSLASAIVPVNDGGALFFETMEPPETDITVQVTIEQTREVQ